MKTKRQKHKAAKARSIAIKTAKKLETEDGNTSKTNGIAQTIEPPKKKQKLERPSSPSKSTKQNPLSAKPQPDDRPDGDRLKRQPSFSKESRTTDAKANLKSKSGEKRKKRKEVTNCSASTLVSDK